MMPFQPLLVFFTNNRTLYHVVRKQLQELNQNKNHNTNERAVNPDSYRDL